MAPLLALLAALPAFAADPAPGAPAPGGPAPASSPGGAVGVEAGLTLATPIAGLGVGPGLRLLADAPVANDRLSVGGEIAVRLPSTASGTLSDPALAEPLEWRSGLAVVAGGARAAYAIGPVEDLHGRVALAGGVAWVAQHTETQVGDTDDRALTGWICPELGVVVPLGPGALTADVLVPVAPASLLVLGDAPGGTAPALSVGWRMAL